MLCPRTQLDGDNETIHCNTKTRSSRDQLHTWGTSNTGILVVRTVMHSKWVVRALQKARLISVTLYVVQPYLPGPLTEPCVTAQNNNNNNDVINIVGVPIVTNYMLAD